MPPGTPDRPSPTLVGLLLLGAIGLAVVFLAVFDSDSWLLLAAGFVAVLTSLAGAWLIQKARDKTLR